MASQSFISRVAPLAAFLLALVVFSSSMILAGRFTAVAQQEGPKKRNEDPGAEQRSPGADVTVRIETRLVNLNGRAYYDAMLMAFEKIGSDSGHRKAMVVVTDGVDDSLAGGRDVDSGDDASPNGAAGELLGRAYDSDVTVYPIYLDTSRRGGSFDRIFSGYFPQKSSNRALAYERLASLADETGGEIFGVSREEDLLEAYQRVASSLHVLYSLAYSPDKAKRNGEFRKVNVKIRREGAVAKTRRGYYDR
jgi:VWFA-related protein